MRLLQSVLFLTLAANGLPDTRKPAAWRRITGGSRRLIGKLRKSLRKRGPASRSEDKLSKQLYKVKFGNNSLMRAGANAHAFNGRSMARIAQNMELLEQKRRERTQQNEAAEARMDAYREKIESLKKILAAKTGGSSAGSLRPPPPPPPPPPPAALSPLFSRSTGNREPTSEPRGGYLQELVDRFARREQNKTSSVSDNSDDDLTDVTQEPDVTQESEASTGSNTTGQTDGAKAVYSELAGRLASRQVDGQEIQARMEQLGEERRNTKYGDRIHATPIWDEIIKKGTQLGYGDREFSSQTPRDSVDTIPEDDMPQVETPQAETPQVETPPVEPLRLSERSDIPLVFQGERQPRRRSRHRAANTSQ